MSVLLLGPVIARSEGTEICLGPPRQRSVFAVLAAHANQVITREGLVSAVWGAKAPATAVNSVYTYVSRLRSSLEPARSRRGSSELITSDSVGYALHLGSERVDTERFDDRRAEARVLANTGQLDSAVQQLDAGLALWQGEPYGGALGPFVESERVRLAELRLTAVEERAGLRYELGRYAELVGELSALVRVHPLREHLRHLLMLCYTGLGRQAEALATYHSLRTMLADELGIEPNPRLQDCYQQILRSGGPEGRRAPARALETAYTVVEPARAAAAALTAQLRRGVPGFAGRAGELKQLHDEVAASQERGVSPLVVLTGAPGAGKTALAVRFARESAESFPDGQLQLDLRGFSGDESPMDPGEAMRRLLMALGVTVLPENPERQKALYCRLVSGRRLLLLLDNAFSADQVRPLLPDGPSCLVIVTSRCTLSGLGDTAGARSLVVDAMEHGDALELFHTVAGVRVHESSTVAALLEDCGHLPLAVRIAAARIGLAPNADWALAQLRGRELIDVLQVPGDPQSSVRAAFGQSLRALGDDAVAQFVALGNLTTPTFTSLTAARLAGTASGVTRDALDALIDANLVREPVEDHFVLNPLIFAYTRYLNKSSETTQGPQAMPV
ncbi:AfsR/SARP family transcriptional regulator [Prauserella cavernicola]|uniref:Winged helix-turn-helix domain-containing protein n=1 Tax=Prauserella cavernicola TaxID=2800127 RepID=A0A934QWR5_9PSEU|nr:BTAD domain-containing putative transcriptional regulator [Prauserella cavernicola]MBK1787846.1 winged helix-turn-helix domain-containing protein [Prauserella cavernicola]